MKGCLLYSDFHKHCKQSPMSMVTRLHKSEKIVNPPAEVQNMQSRQGNTRSCDCVEAGLLLQCERMQKL
eukprot:4964008-Amphidinium_carterae.1